MEEDEGKERSKEERKKLLANKFERQIDDDQRRKCISVSQMVSAGCRLQGDARGKLTE